jgi:hypothetical protein
MISSAKQVAVAVIPDRQKQNMNYMGTRLATDTASTRSWLSRDVRRPTRGIQIKEDTYATLSVMLADGTYIPLVNAGSRTGTLLDNKMRDPINSNFMIQAVQEERVEKSQVVETFGEAFIFFYGERPRVLNVQGVLINTFDFNWEAEWWFNYDNYLRGTKCVEKRARVYLMYDETLVSGYIMGTNSTKQSEQRNFVPFSFQFFITDYINISKLGDPNPNPNAGLLTGESNESLQGLDYYRPQLLDYRETAINRLSSGGDLLSKLSLFEAMANQAVSAVQDAWTQVNQIVDNVLLSADAMLGGPVRIPSGFQGALAFDEDTFVQGEPGLAEPIRYTTKFGDNEDEFVGTSAQYNTSSLSFGDNLSEMFDMSSSFDGQDDMLSTATLQWAAHGLFVPPAAVTKAVGLISKTGIGMQVLQGARSGVAGVGAGVSVVRSVAAPVVAGSMDVMGGLALAAGTAADVPAAETQFTNQGIAVDNSLSQIANSTAGAVDRAKTSGVDAYKGFTAAPGFSPVLGGQAGTFTGQSS